MAGEEKQISQLNEATEANATDVTVIESGLATKKITVLNLLKNNASLSGDNIKSREFLKNLGIEIGTFYSRNDSVTTARVQMQYIRIKKFYSDDKDLLMIRTINYLTWYGTGGAWTSAVWRIPPYLSAAPAPTVDYQVYAQYYVSGDSVRLLDNLQTAYRFRLPSGTPNTGGVEVCYKSTTPSTSELYSWVHLRIQDLQIDTNLVIASEY